MYWLKLYIDSCKYFGVSFIKFWFKAVHVRVTHVTTRDIVKRIQQQKRLSVCAQLVYPILTVRKVSFMTKSWINYSFSMVMMSVSLFSKLLSLWPLEGESGLRVDSNWYYVIITVGEIFILYIWWKKALSFNINKFLTS